MHASLRIAAAISALAPLALTGRSLGQTYIQTRPSPSTARSAGGEPVRESLLDLRRMAKDRRPGQVLPGDNARAFVPADDEPRLAVSDSTMDASEPIAAATESDVAAMSERDADVAMTELQPVESPEAVRIASAEMDAIDLPSGSPSADRAADRQPVLAPAPEHQPVMTAAPVEPVPARDETPLAVTVTESTPGVSPRPESPRRPASEAALTTQPAVAPTREEQHAPMVAAAPSVADPMTEPRGEGAQPPSVEGSRVVMGDAVGERLILQPVSADPVASPSATHEPEVSGVSPASNTATPTRSNALIAVIEDQLDQAHASTPEQPVPTAVAAVPAAPQSPAKPVQPSLSELDRLAAELSSYPGSENTARVAEAAPAHAEARTVPATTPVAAVSADEPAPAREPVVDLTHQAGARSASRPAAEQPVVPAPKAPEITLDPASQRRPLAARSAAEPAPGARPVVREPVIALDPEHIASRPRPTGASVAAPVDPAMPTRTVREPVIALDDPRTQPKAVVEPSAAASQARPEVVRQPVVALDPANVPLTWAPAPARVRVVQVDGAANNVQWRSAGEDSASAENAAKPWKGLRVGDELTGRVQVRTGIGAAATFEVDGRTLVEVDRLTSATISRSVPSPASVKGLPVAGVDLQRGRVSVLGTAAGASRPPEGEPFGLARISTPDETVDVRTSATVEYNAFTGTRTH